MAAGGRNSFCRVPESSGIGTSGDPWEGKCAGLIQARIIWEESFNEELFRSGWSVGMSVYWGAEAWLLIDIGRFGPLWVTAFPTKGLLNSEEEGTR